MMCVSEHSKYTNKLSNLSGVFLLTLKTSNRNYACTLKIASRVQSTQLAAKACHQPGWVCSSPCLLPPPTILSFLTTNELQHLKHLVSGRTTLKMIVTDVEISTNLLPLSQTVKFPDPSIS